MKIPEPPKKSATKIKNLLMDLVPAVLAIGVITLTSYAFSFEAIYLSLKENSVPIIVAISIIAIYSTFKLVPMFLSQDISEKTVVPLTEFQKRLEEVMGKSSIEGEINENSAPINPSASSEVDLLISPLVMTIYDHIKQLKSSSTLNLMIGIAGIIGTIGLLGLNLIEVFSYQSFQEFIFNFLPRFSFVIVIQVSAFFFLRLYKTNLEDTKYFQNELTNMMAKTVAFKIAYQQEDKVLIAKLATELSSIERNFKLASGESLLNIEKAKIEKDLDLDSIRTMKQFLRYKQSDNEK